MTFPQTPRDIMVGLYLRGGWRDVSGDVRGASKVTIVRGRRNESSLAPPSSCSLVLDNRNGSYSPRLPTGQWYGSIGQNAPLRVAVAMTRDTFDRTVTGGWGSTNNGQPWSWSGSGTPLASDFNVADGKGTHLVSDASSYRFTYLAGLDLKLVDVVVTVSLPFTDVTGGQIEPANILLRGTSVTNYYMVRVAIGTDESVTVAIYHYGATVLVGPVSTGITHSASQPIRIRANVEGSTIRAKVWQASAAEPFTWNVVAYDTTVSESGWIAIRSGVASGNTNVPVTFSYDDVVVSVPRCHGEISSINPRWDLSGEDVTAEVVAGGILRRFGQGASPIGSSMRRGLLRTTTVVAYWPCEDATNSDRISSGLTDGLPMEVVGGDAKFASDTSFACSDPIPTPDTSTWIGRVPSHSVVDRTQTRFLMSVPSGGITDQTVMSVILTGTALRIDVDINSAGSLRVAAYSSSGAQLGASGYNTFEVNGSPRWISLEYWQISAGTIAVNLATLEPGAATGLQLSLGGITFSGTVGVTQWVQINPIGSVGIGHISVHREWTSLFDLGQELAAWNGELAADRLKRLCTEEDVSFALTGRAVGTAVMGPMRSKTLGALLDECAQMDQGTLYDALGDAGLGYRTLADSYNQSVSLSLDYSLGQLSMPFDPIDDDQLVRNDVTVKREGGGEARAELVSGRLSTLPPQSGGIGRYDTSVTVNAYEDDQTGDLAWWLLRQGTVNESRYPVIAVDLANPSVVSAELEDAVLSAGIDDRIAVSNPKSIHTVGQISQLLRGYTEVLGTFEHNFRFVCTPESPRRVLALGSAAHVLDSYATVLTSSIASDATSFQVTISDETLWTTNAGDMPVLITIGGEEMSVGSISGTSSPQTFSSVTRSLNGVVKAHDGGNEVHVTNPIHLALWGD